MKFGLPPADKTRSRSSFWTAAATTVAFLALVLGATLGLVDHEHLSAQATDLCADDHSGTDLTDQTSLHSATRLHDHECPACGSTRVRPTLLEESSVFSCRRSLR